MTCTRTATQLRNARKRRARKRTQRVGGVSSSSEAARPLQHPSQRPTKRRQCVDPSQQYLDNPYAAPSVKAAQKFFRDIFEPQKKKKTTTTTVISCPLEGDDDSTATAAVFPIHLGPLHGWRTVVKLPVRGARSPSIGLFLPGSHRMLPVVDPLTQQCRCATHHPAINRAIVRIQGVLDQGIVTAYSEQTGQGLLRHVALSLERATQRVQLVLVWNDEKSTGNGSTNQAILNTLWQALVQSPSSVQEKVQWHSIWVHYNTLSKHSNAIYNVDGPWDLLYSTRNAVDQMKESTPLGVTEYLRAEEEEEEDEKGMEGSTKALCLPRIPLYFPPQVFRQGNLTAFAKIVASIRRSWIQSGWQVDKCLELYGGVGTIGLHLVDLLVPGGVFVGSDENPYNIACFDAAARSLRCASASSSSSSARKILRYASAAASEMVVVRQEHRLAQVIIVDPPRKGLDLAVARALTERVPALSQTLFYVSCGFAAFVRDYALLTDAAAPRPWTLQRAEGHILFPGSDAIETLAVLTR
jgi:tRNA/tmRNA/rRNA uracil-C5-methylase (TrmA/RlmC/RlmD family)